jgi:chromosome segregation ATPase
MGIDDIQNQSQQIIAGATEEFANLKSRIEGCENKQGQMKIKQASLTLSYNILQKRMAELEDYVKRGLPNFDDLQVVTERINEISNQTTGLTEAVAVAKFSNTTPDRRGRIEQVQQWQQKTDERNRSISPIIDSDVAQITGMRGGSGTDAGMEDPEPG